MSEQVTLRVRPGFAYGARRQFQGGDTFTVSEAESVQLLAAFGDKLEQVAGEELTPSTADAPVIEAETPEPVPAKRTRKPGGL